MKVKIDEIRDTIQKVLFNYGYKGEEAKIIADEYLEGELQGKHSHGLECILYYLKKNLQKSKTYKVIKKTNSFLFVDAKNIGGSVVGIDVSKKLIQMANKQGIALGLIKDMSAWLRPSTIAQFIAEKGYIAFVVNSGS